ncbi:MAG TPA: septum formation initiator family protein [Gaiellaceae bacterium]|nr:septum formation initiator family protein [Gaiellaceae bacterium]
MRWVALGAIVLVGLLYARPLRSYVQTKHDLARRAADVRTLKADRRALQHRLAESTTGEALARQARRLGLVRPGERLFIVKGISAWVHGRDRSNRQGR